MEKISFFDPDVTIGQILSASDISYFELSGKKLRELGKPIALYELPNNEIRILFDAKTDNFLDFKEQI